MNSCNSCNNWNSFRNYIENTKSNLTKNAFPPSFIDKIIKKYLDHMFSSNENQLKDISDAFYFKLPYIGNLSKLCKEFCKENFNIKLVFNSFKIKNYFSCKDAIPDDLKLFIAYKFTCASYSSSYINNPDDLKSFIAYKFTCVSCSSSYTDKTCCHFKSRIEEHMKKDNKSHIFKHLHPTATSFNSYNSLCFKIIDKANSRFDLKVQVA